MRSCVPQTCLTIQKFVILTRRALWAELLFKCPRDGFSPERGCVEDQPQQLDRE